MRKLVFMLMMLSSCHLLSACQTAKKGDAETYDSSSAATASDERKDASASAATMVAPLKGF